MPITLDSLTADHYEVVRGPGDLLIRVKRCDPRMLSRVPWLISHVLREASPKVDPNEDPYAAIEAEARQGNKSREEIDAERMEQMCALAREVVMAFGKVAKTEDGQVTEEWRDVVLVDTEAERADVPGEPLRIEVGFLDRISIMAVCHAAVARLEAVTQRIAPFLKTAGRRNSVSAG
jgi:hypothetical protein